MVRKIKVLIGLFVAMLILSIDLGSLFAKDTALSAQMEQEVMEQEVMEQETTENQESFFSFANLQHNLGCITGAIKSAVVEKTQVATEKYAGKYDEAIAEVATKEVEKVITKSVKQ